MDLDRRPLGPRTFDVICAGDGAWRATLGRMEGVPGSAVSAGLVEVACALARRGARVGLATTLPDDRGGRALRRTAAAAGVDVDGVTLAPPPSGLVLVDAAGQSTIGAEEAARELAIPAAWSSSVLLLAGLSPRVDAAAALCRAARRARRDGSTVVLDVAGSARRWWGHDPRTLAMVIRSADVVRCTLMSLAVVGLDVSAVRRAMRPGAVLVTGDEAGTTAAGPFGEVHVGARSGDDAAVLVASICAELARPSRGLESLEARWERALRPPPS